MAEPCFLSVEDLLFLGFATPFFAFVTVFFLTERFVACFAGVGITEVAETVVPFVPATAAEVRSSAADAVVNVERAKTPTTMRALIEFIDPFSFRYPVTLGC